MDINFMIFFSVVGFVFELGNNFYSSISLTIERVIKQKQSSYLVKDLFLIKINRFLYC